MNKTSSTPKEISNNRIIWGRLCGATAIFFASIWIMLNILFAFQLANGDYDDPIGFFLFVVLTAPPVFFASVMQVILVGFRRSKLSWIACGIYTAPFVIMIGALLFMQVEKTIKGWLA